MRRYLETEARARRDLIHLRVDEFVSRQTARLVVLDRIQTPYAVLVDNNMLFRWGWLDALLDCAKETGAAMVSPVIVTQGGHIHFSGGFVVPYEDGIGRPHAQKGGPVNAQVESARLERLDIDFAESHCCLARTECLLRPDVMKEAMHNAQTLCYAAYLLKHRDGERIVIEPRAVVSLLPISFGYDIPWMCESYMDRELLRDSYEHLTRLIGKGPSQDPDTSFEWHAMHFKYLLLTMLEGARLNRTDLLRSEEVPAFVTGYDRPLPQNHMRQINEDIVPYVQYHHPRLFPQMKACTGQLASASMSWAAIDKISGIERWRGRPCAGEPERRLARHRPQREILHARQLLQPCLGQPQGKAAGGGRWTSCMTSSPRAGSSAC